MENYIDPILAAANPSVPALPALTQPFGTTIVADYYYFKSVQPNCSTIRTDGKRITFHNSYHKTNIAEDVAFLRKCIASDPSGPFKEVVGEDIAIAEAVLDPRAAMEKALRTKILAELVATGVITADALNTSAADPSLETAVDSTADSLQTLVDAGNAGVNLLGGVDAATAAAQKLANLRAQASQGAAQISSLTGTAVPLLTPVSTSDLAAAAAGSNSGAAGLGSAA